MIEVCNVTSGVVGGSGKQKKAKAHAPVLLGFWRVLPLRPREVLPGRRRLPPPGAVSTGGRLRPLSPYRFSSPSPRENPWPCRGSSGPSVQTPFNSKELPLIGASSKPSPTPSPKIRHSLVSLSVTQHFFQLIGPTQAPFLSLLVTL